MRGVFLPDFAYWRTSATPFSQIGGLPLYTTQLSSDIMISKGSENKPIYSAFKKERNVYERTYT